MRGVSVDGGTNTIIQALNDDGTPGAQGVDISALGTLTALVINAQSRWPLFSSTLSDGGSGSEVWQLSGSLGLSRAATFTNGPVTTLVATVNHLAAVAVTPTLTQVEYLTTSPQVTITAGLSCVSPVSARGDDVWLGCGISPMTFFPPTGLRTLVVSPDAGWASAVVFAGDGGTVVPQAVLTSGSPEVLYRRVFDNLGRGDGRGVLSVSLRADGLASLGPPVPALLRPAGQGNPAFSTRQPGEPLALLWYDERQLPQAPLLAAVRLTTGGDPIMPSAPLEPLTFNFTSSNSLCRYGASDTLGFVAGHWNGFEVVPLHWSLVGAVVSATQLTSFGLYGPPMLTAHPGGYFISWSNFPSDWVGRWLDTNGQPAAGQVSIAPASYGSDALSLGGQSLQLVSGPGSLRVVSVAPWGSVADFATVASNDAGVYYISRMARSPSVLLVAWLDVAQAQIEGRRYAFDGGVLDATPLLGSVSTVTTPGNVADIGFRNGVFTVAGTAPNQNSFWLWNVSEDAGADSVVTVIDGFSDNVQTVSIGPTIDDGGLLIAYSHGVPDFGGAVQRMYLSTLGDDLGLGVSCGRHSDWLCLGVCTVDAGTVDGGSPIDAGPSDAGPELDAGALDGGAEDGGAVDGGAVGGGVADSGADLINDGGASRVDGGAEFALRELRVGCGCTETSGGAGGFALVLMGVLCLRQTRRRGR